MTEVLTELITTTNKVFEGELKVPEPSQDWKRKLEVLEQASLVRQKGALLFDLRCWQAEQLGFKRMTIVQMVEALMGQPHTDIGAGTERQHHEWYYNHHTDVTLAGKDCNWGDIPTQYFRMEKKNTWYLPPYNKQEAWRCQFGKLDYIKRQIPYGVLLRIEELKKMKLFNAFNILAPMEAWTSKIEIDPIVVASIWEITTKDPTADPKKYDSSGQDAHFFIAQW